MTNKTNTSSTLVTEIDKSKIEDTLITETNTPTKASANQNAADLPSTSTKAPAVCPLSKEKIQLFPLRYAVVENLKPDTKTVEEQPLQSHPIGLRLIRDGYLYIFDVGLNTFYEYTLKEGEIESLTFKGNNVEIDQRTACVGDPTLVFNKTKTLSLFVSYSEIQWAAKKCNLIIKDPEIRAEFMQSIGLWNVDCSHQNQHLITEQKAQQWLVEQSEKPTTPTVTPLFEEEKTPYIWEDKTISNYQPTTLGKLKSQLVAECKEGNYLFLIVEDYIGMMKDLTAEQSKITQWLDKWSNIKDEKGTNSLKYTIGNYIDSTLVVNDQNAESKQVAKSIQALPDDKRQAIYDYINASIKEAKYDGVRFIRTGASLPTYDGISYDMTPEYLRLVQAKKDAYNNMKNTLGKDAYQAYESEIKALEDSERNYTSGGLTTRGIRQLVNIGELDSYLAKERPRFKNWQNQLEKITQDRVYLYTNYFHNATWYYDNSKDEQLEGVLQCELECSSDMLRNDESSDKLAEFFEAHPYYRMPAFQTGLTANYIAQKNRKIKRLFDDATKYIKMLTENKSTALEELEELIGHGYWKKIIDLPVKAQHIQNLLTINFSDAINKSLNKLLEDIETPKFSTTTQTKISNNLAKFERLVKKLNLAQRMDFMLAVRQTGLVVISDKPDAFLKAERYINNMADNIETIKQNTSAINSLNRNIKKINANKGQYKNESPEVKKQHIISMKTRRDKLLTENNVYKQTLTLQQKGLQSLVSPLDAGENPFTIRMNNSTEQQQLLAYEKQMINHGFKGEFGAKGAAKHALNNSKLATCLFVLQVYNLKSALEEYFEKLKINPDEASRLPIIMTVLGTLSGSFSVAQVFQVQMLKYAINHLKETAKDAAGVRLAAKLSKITLLFSAASQFLGLASNTLLLYKDHAKWSEALMSDEPAVRNSALATIAGNYGSAAVSIVGGTHVILTSIGILQDLEKAQLAKEVIWAVRGAKFATAMARLTPWGLAFTALQIGGEFAYSYFNLSDSQQWFHRCCWGKNIDKKWDQKEHNQQLAEFLLKPWLEDKGVEQDKEGNYYRVLQLSIPGQNYDTLQERPLGIHAAWQMNKDLGDLSTQLLQSAKVVKHSAPLTLEWRLPWVSEQEWKILNQEVKGHYNKKFSSYGEDVNIDDYTAAIFSGLGDYLLLILRHTPDMAHEPLANGKGGIGFKVNLTTWDINRPKPAYIEPVSNASSSLEKLLSSTNAVNYRG